MPPRGRRSQDDTERTETPEATEGQRAAMEATESTEPAPQPENTLAGVTAPAEHMVANQSFYNPALVGSGTINEDSQYQEPLPDPTVVRGLGPDRTSGGRRTHGAMLGGTAGEGVHFDADAAPASAGRDNPTRNRDEYAPDGGNPPVEK
jgi:hypothetical protein